MLEILQKRRSVRLFQNRLVEAEKIDTLTEALLRSPSSRGRNPWEFVVVTDPATLQRLAKSKAHGSEFLSKAPLAVAVCADPRKCDVWVEDCAIAAIILQLTAESLGLVSCWAQIRLRDHADGRSAENYVQETLNLPDGYVVASIIGIGYPEQRPQPHPKESLAYEKIHRERYKG
jgi:nitroreductase